MQRIDISSIVENVIYALKAGEIPWHKRWNIPLPLRHNGLMYKGMNVLLLWDDIAQNGYSSPFYFTYRQAQQLGGQVRKGSKGQIVFYSSSSQSNDKIEESEKKENKAKVLYSFIKKFNVFNAENIDHLPDEFYGKIDLRPSHRK